MKKIGLLLFLRYSLALCPHKTGFPSLSEMPIGMLRSICRISVGASAWNTIFRQNCSIIITGVAAEIGGMWALRWRSPEPRDEACAISVIITDVIRVRAGGGFWSNWESVPSRRIVLRSMIGCIVIAITGTSITTPIANDMGSIIRTSTGIRNTRNMGSGNTGDIMTMITTMTRMMTIEWPVIIPCKSLYV